MMNNTTPPRRYTPWLGIVLALIVMGGLVIIWAVRGELQGSVMHTGAQAPFTAPNHGGIGEAPSPVMEDRALNGRHGVSQAAPGGSGKLNGTTEPVGGLTLPPGPKMVNGNSKAGTSSSNSGGSASKSGQSNSGAVNEPVGTTAPPK